MTEQKHTNDPLNVDEALSTSEAFLIKNKNVLFTFISLLVNGIEYTTAAVEPEVKSKIFLLSFITLAKLCDLPLWSNKIG